MGLFSREKELREAWTLTLKSPLTCAPSAMTVKSAHYAIVGTKAGTIVCIDSTGKIAWEVDLRGNFSATESFFVDENIIHSIVASPTIADIDRDGTPEIIACSARGIVTCLTHEGKLKWSHDTKGPLRASAAVEDVNLDGIPEVLVGSGDRLLVLTASGKPLFEYHVDSLVESTPGVIKGKQPLIVFGTRGGTVFAITPAQELIWRKTLAGSVVAAPVEIPSREERRVLIGTVGGVLYCMSEHGEEVWSFKTQGGITSAAVVHDLDDDHQPEAVFGSCDNTIYAVSADGKRMWSYETDFWVPTTPIVTDLDLDGKLEVVAASYDHSVYVLDAQGEFVMEYVPGVAGIVNQGGHYSTLLTSEPGEQAGKRRWQYRLASIVVGCTVLAVQGAPQIIACTKAGTVSCLKLV